MSFDTYGNPQLDFRFKIPYGLADARFAELAEIAAEIRETRQEKSPRSSGLGNS